MRAKRSINRRDFLKGSAGVIGGALLASRFPQATLAPAQAAPASSATIRIALGIDPDTLDPAGQTSTTTQNQVDYMAETLVRPQADGTTGPGLAERWVTAADGKSWAFYLRRGVKFHDGDTLNARAVKQSLERYLNASMRVPLRAPLGDVIDAVDMIGEYSVRIGLKYPFPALAAALTGTATSIVSPQHARAFPDKYNDEPVGTGAYKFKERRKGESLTLVRNEDYWGRKPYFGTVQFRTVPEATTREILLLAEQVDVAILPPASDIPKLQQDRRIKVLLAASNRTIFVALDNSRAVLQDKRVRHALNYAVDKEGIIKNVLFGAATPSNAPIAPEFFGYTRCGYYAYDPNKAKQLLQDAGASNLSLKMIYPTGRYLQDAQASQAIAANWRDVGVTVDASTMDWPTYTAAFNVPPERATSDCHFLGLASYFLDAVHATLPMKGSLFPPAGLNTAHYRNARVDELIEAAARELDQRKRAQMYAEVLKTFWDDAPWVFLWEQRFPIAYSAKIKGVGATPIEKFACMYAEPAT